MKKTNGTNPNLTYRQVLLLFAGTLLFFRFAPQEPLTEWPIWWLLGPLYMFDIALLVIAGVIWVAAFISNLIANLIEGVSNR